MASAAVESQLRPAIHVVRYMVGSVLLLALVIFPVVGTHVFNTLGITHATTFLLWAFALAMLPETVAESKRLLESKALLVSTCTLGACLASWLIFPGEFDGMRCLFMVGIACCLPATIGWFRHSGARGLTLLVWTKACVLAYAALRFGIAILQQAPADELFNRPPVYRHLRHFNYDLSIMSGLALGLLHTGRWTQQAGWMTAYFLLGFFSFWSGGRGGVLTTGLISAAWLLGKPTIEALRTAARLMTAFLAGGLAVLVSNQTNFLFHALARSSRDTFDAISSSRLTIWMKTWQVVTSDLRASMLGHSPEAFINLGVHQTPTFHPTHPHSAILQWLLEYGFLGTAAVLIAMLALGWRHVLPRLLDGTPTERTIASTLVGMTAFSFVDGVFYHAAPLIFVTILLAYLISGNARTVT